MNTKRCTIDYTKKSFPQAYFEYRQMTKGSKKEGRKSFEIEMLNHK